MKKTKTKSAPAIKWVKPKASEDNRFWGTEWLGYTGGETPVFEITDDGVLFFKAGDSILLGSYSAPRSAKRGAERFAKRMREIFA